MTREKISTIIKSAPKEAGVYTFFDSKKKPLYIGKAFNLKNRLKNYLATNDSRILKMIEQAEDIKITPLESDIEALIIESQLIKHHRPAFNIVMRDDKQYFYVGFSPDTFPKVFLTHQPRDEVSFIGPFTDGTALKTTLRHLRKIFPYCTCKQTHHNFCLNYHIGKCFGFCCLKNKQVSPEQTVEYRTSIKSIKDILSGKKNNVTASLIKEMKVSATKEEFEKAMRLQTTIDRLEKVFKNARIINGVPNETHHNDLGKLLGTKKQIQRIEGYDISNIQGQSATGSMVVFNHGQPDKNQYRIFKIKTVKDSNDTAMLKEVLLRRFKHQEWKLPDLIIVDGGKGQLNAALSVIPNNIPLIALTKDSRHFGTKIFLPRNSEPLGLAKIPVAAKNLILKIDSEAHRFAISYYRRLHRKQLRI